MAPNALRSAAWKAFRTILSDKSPLMQAFLAWLVGKDQYLA
ncbi:hypothetical protein QY903_14980 [Lactiplantibacillus paraplantarum]